MASGPPLVSVLVAASKRTVHLREAVDSVLAQTHRPLELIVVDAGADGTTALSARRRALRAARGAYVAFLDGDDVFLPHKVAQQAALLDATPRLGAVHCRHHDVDAAGRVVDTAARQPEGDLRSALLRGFLPWSGGPLFRRELLLTIGDDEPLEWLGDWWISLRVALAGHEQGCVQKPLGCRRARSARWTEASIRRDLRGVLDLLGQAHGRWALPADVMAQQEQIRAVWLFRFGCRYAFAGAAEASARSFTRAAALCPEWCDDAGPPIELLHAEATSSDVRTGDAVELLEGALDRLPPELAHVRAGRAVLLGRVHVALALRALATGDRAVAHAHLASAVRADPGLLSAPERFAGELVGHARRLAADDPRTLVEQVLDELPPCARPLAQARVLALAELAVVEAVRRHRLPAGQRRAACVTVAGARPPELMLRPPRRPDGRSPADRAVPNPRRCASHA